MSPQRAPRARRPGTTAAPHPPGAAVVRRAHRLLEKHLGPLDPPRRLDPLEELILTVLSQNTSDVNRDRAYASLLARFASWQEVLDADTLEVADAIRMGGLANTKAPRIQAILRAIEEREGSPDLSSLHRMSDGEIRDYLMSLPGVGPKTAACVLAFSLARPALPVDTHVLRVGRRLGWIPPKASAEQAHDVMEHAVPAALRLTMHIGLIRLGRRICKPGRPRCEECPLQDLCATAPVVLSGAWEKGGVQKSG